MSVCDGNFPDRLLGESGTPMRVEDASLVPHNVPGDGNCFFHTIAGAFIKSIHMWREIKDDSGNSLCDKITNSWFWFLRTNPWVTPEEHFDQGFFRFIAMSQVTEESVRLFRATHYQHPINPEDIPLDQARLDMEKHVLQTGSFGDQHSLSLLNKYLEGFLRIHVYDEVTRNWVGRGEFNNTAYILISLRNEHYKLFQFQGRERSFFISREQMERQTPRLLMTLLGIPIFETQTNPTVIDLT